MTRNFFLTLRMTEDVLTELANFSFLAPNFTECPTVTSFQTKSSPRQETKEIFQIQNCIEYPVFFLALYLGPSSAVMTEMGQQSMRPYSVEPDDGPIAFARLAAPAKKIRQCFAKG